MLIGSIATSFYSNQLYKKYKVQSIINKKIQDAKSNFNNEIYGYWIFKKKNEYIGSINIKIDNKIIEHPFKIDNKLMFRWQED
ncbi:hypothetical protein MOO46_01325 [Apilactobacillus apisilvae]|uniref:Uncharacterized protein n=1 Tax=Apilactobacillus apisilvae TaxID=2923364 RepID=A0ABY4PIL5_9LACO|nr:hypothetical protein [Apilactobacillus apisilvae]UQS85257.1 hypothetical protein MOO46_01325 [Apilactobacillus apisilvae]